MSWETAKDKLICFMLVDDSLGIKVCGPSAKGIAFWRAFILEDRQTGEIHAVWRFKYPDGNTSWTEITCTNGLSGDAAKNHLRCALEDVINKANDVFGLPQKVECFYPPDDGGDPGKTLLWLDEHDLIEFRVEKIDPKKGDGGHGS
jgi:hypothetical protein